MLILAIDNAIWPLEGATQFQRDVYWLHCSGQKLLPSSTKQRQSRDVFEANHERKQQHQYLLQL